MSPARPFTIVSRTRPFALVSPGFEQVEAGPTGQVGMHRSGVAPVAPFAAIEMGLDPASDREVAAGLLDSSGDGVLVQHDPGRAQVRLVLRSGGADRVLRRRRVRGRPMRLAFVLCENQLSAAVDTGRGWRAVATERATVARLLDLRDPAVLMRHGYAWGPVDDGPVPATVGPVLAGPFGLTGVRDPHLVQHADGTPYVRDGLIHLTMTCAGTGFFPQAHWGVFTLDPAQPGRLTQVAHLFSRRDGLVLGDHAGQIVVDGNRAHVLVSSWGDFTPAAGVHVRQTRTGLEVLSGVHVLDTVPLPLPTRHSAWDPAATLIGGRWHVAFVASPSQRPFDFHPALAVGPDGGGWGEPLQPAGADPSRHHCEGPVLARVDGAWRLLASDGHSRVYPVYDLRVRRVGELPAPYVTNIPHPQLVPLPAGSPLGSELMVTFDGTGWGGRVLGYGTHGDLVVMAR